MSIPGIDHAISADVKESLEALQFDLSEWNKNPRIGGLLSRTVLAGGKRLRPLLTLVMGDLFGAKHKDIEKLAQAVELVHAATLAHDDVIDDADVRRGKPSINAAASNKKAVLAGDYLLAHSLSEVAGYNRPQLVACLSEIISDLAEGEWIQIENSNKEKLSREDVTRVALKKTGSVLRWCAEAPALFLELPQEVSDKAREFGECLGIAFQMTDDILDFKREDGAEFADLKNKVVNAVIFEAITQKEGKDFINTAAIDELSLDQDYISSALETVGRQVSERLNRCRELALEFSQLPLPEDLHGPRQNAFFSVSCIIEYIAKRI